MYSLSHTFLWKKYLGTRELYQTIARIAVPVAMQQLITVGINLADTVMLSSMGDNQLSASSLAGQFINIFQICCMGIGSGASVLFSRYWGRKDLRSLKISITIMFRFCFLFSLTFTLITLFAPETIMRIYSNDPQIIQYGSSYFKWILPTYFCMGFCIACTFALRSISHVRIPLCSSIFAFFINIFFNWVFIFGHFGFPRMEIAGAALGTLISRIFELLFICGYFFFFEKKIAYRLRDLAMRCGVLLYEYVKICLPVLISDFMLGLGNNMIAVIMGHIGASFVAANSITTVLQQLSIVLAQGIAHASGIITGQTLGKGDFEKAQNEGYTFLLLGLFIGCAASILILLLRNPIVDYYQVSSETREIALELLNAISFIIIFQCMNVILTKGVLRAGGDSRFLMAGDILFLWIVSIPFGALAGLVFHWSAFWIYVLLKLEHIIKCFWCFSRLRSKKWQKQIQSVQ